MLDFLYYRLYRALLKTSARDVAEYAACFWLVSLLAINIIVIIDKMGLKPLEILPARVWSASFEVPMFILFYFIFVHSKRYLKIIDRYLKESEQQRRRGNLVLILYIMTTFAAVFLC